MADMSVVRLLPQTYLHVLDNTTNVTRVELGPKTLVVQRHEQVVGKPEEMITIPPRHYIVLKNPVQRDEGGKVVFGEKGLAMLQWGETEVRLAQEPFPLYPGEIIEKDMTKLQMVYKNTALHLQAIDDFTDHDGVKRSVGDQYLFEGPGTYVPNTREVIVKSINATVVKQNQALRMRALDDCVDRNGVKRVAGEDYLIREIGAYLPGVFERKLSVITAHVLTDKKALHVRAMRTFVDQFEQERLMGDVWLITAAAIETFIPSEHEEVVREVTVTTLSSRQFCVITNPLDAETGTNLFGQFKLIVGEKSFFLAPGEYLEKGIQNVYVLNEEEGLVLSCEEAFTEKIDGKTMERKPGDRWMIKGPMEFIPPIGACVERVNKAIALGDNEGIYVRNSKTGEVRAIIGRTYLMNEDEQLWEKQLPDDVEELLATEKGVLSNVEQMSDLDRAVLQSRMASRDKTRVVTYNVPHNHAVQIFDFKNGVGRCVFGPALVLLEPGEVITSLVLSGGKPKEAGVVRCLHLRLGPEFSSDLIIVETSDHCKLRVALSYNWQFAIAKSGTEEENERENAKLFDVEDFIGDLCKTLSSRIRSAVASVAFEDFHKTSARLIRSTIFGTDEHGKIQNTFLMPSNNLVITGVDIRSIEPEDPSTREALQRSVQLAIEITAKTQEAVARHKQAILEQQASGLLERQRLVDAAEAEVANKQFTEAQVETRAVKNTGKARAEAQSKAETKKIAAQAAVEEAELEAEARKIELASELEELVQRQNAEIEYLKQKFLLDEVTAQKSSDIELKKFTEIIKSVGADTISAVFVAGPELQRKLLSGLGLDADFLKALPFIG